MRQFILNKSLEDRLNSMIDLVEVIKTQTRNVEVYKKSALGLFENQYEKNHNIEITEMVIERLNQRYRRLYESCKPKHDNMKSHIRGANYLISVDTEAKTLTLVGGSITTDELVKILSPYSGYEFFHKKTDNNNGIIKGLEPISTESKVDVDITPQPQFGDIRWFRNDTLLH